MTVRLIWRVRGGFLPRLQRLRPFSRRAKLIRFISIQVGQKKCLAASGQTVRFSNQRLILLIRRLPFKQLTF